MRILEATVARSNVWQRLLLMGMAALVATSLIACSSDEEKDEAPAATASDARELTNEFLALLQKKDTTGLQGFLAESFILQRADGSSATKADYLTRLPEIGQFSIDNVIFKQTGSALVVRWDLTVVETINGQPYRGTPAPRLSTFVYDADDWRMTSHANFNAPAAPPPASTTN